MIVALHKPRGPTSHDIIDAVRHITGERRVGHAGTLDPMAEGVLVVGIGRDATRQLSSIVEKEKEYHAIVQLGATSTTDDAEGIIRTSVVHGAEPNLTSVHALLPQFIGPIAQIPPAYSAIKVRGTPAHRRARRGEPLILAPRSVTIRAIELLRYEWPALEIHVICGPGTYIRALARDIGDRLGVGGYLTALTRTRVGTHTLADALTLEGFTAYWSSISHHTSNKHPQ